MARQRIQLNNLSTEQCGSAITKIAFLQPAGLFVILISKRSYIYNLVRIDFV